MKMKKRKIRKTADLGEYDEKITVQQQSEVSDGGAGAYSSWSDMITVWAKITTKSPNALEAFAGGSHHNKTITFSIIYTSIVYTVPIGKLRVVYPITGNNKKAYSVKSVDPVGMKEWEIEIVAKSNEFEAV